MMIDNFNKTKTMVYDFVRGILVAMVFWLVLILFINAVFWLVVPLVILGFVIEGLLLVRRLRK